MTPNKYNKEPRKFPSIHCFCFGRLKDRILHNYLHSCNNYLANIGNMCLFGYCDSMWQYICIFTYLQTIFCRYWHYLHIWISAFSILSLLTHKNISLPGYLHIDICNNLYVYKNVLPLLPICIYTGSTLPTWAISEYLPLCKSILQILAISIYSS